MSDLETDVEVAIERGKKFVVDDWRRAWKWMSVQFAALFGLLATLQAALHDNASELGSLTQSKWYSTTMVFLAVAGIVGRLIPQPVSKDIEAAKQVTAETVK